MMRILFLFLFLFSAHYSVSSQGENAKSISVIIDADTANEIDDIYAIVRALSAPEINVVGITSAHFVNSPLASNNSVLESQKVNEAILDLMNIKDIDLPLGSNLPLQNESTPQISQAAEYIVVKANEMKDGERLQVVVLGPCTNVASAILIDSSIVDKIEVSYIGFWHDREKETWSKLEFNSGNDIKAVNVIMNTPRIKFNSMTATTSGKLIFEMENARNHLFGRGGIKSFMFNRWLNHKRWWSKDDPKKSQWNMWDLAIIEALIDPNKASIEILDGPLPNNGEKINVYTAIDVGAMKKSFWEAIDKMQNQNEQKYLIKSVNIVDPSSGTITYNKDVVVEYGRIKSFSAPDNMNENEECITINGSGNFLMPGLSEMHAHIPVPDEDLGEDYVQDVMHLYLANGVTVIRGMLGNPYHIELKKKLLSGEIIGPRMYTSSPSMNGNSIPDSVVAREKVKSASLKGYDFLKIHPGIKADVMATLVDEANNVGIGFSGHVPFDVGIRNALKYKYSTVDHVDGYIRGMVPDDENITSEDVGFFGYGLIKKVRLSKRFELAKLAKAQQVWQVPTQSLFARWFSPTSAAEMMAAQEFSYIPAKIRFTWRTNKDRMIAEKSYTKRGHKRFMRIRKKMIQALHQSGVQFLLGSDSPQVMNVPGYSIHHEIDALKDCGLSSFDIIKMGTINPAIFFDEIDRFGSIKIGADADFIIVEQNPFDRLETMRLPLGTMIQGRWLDREYFNKTLEKIETKFKE
ncbi:MAG: amidohydrolase family protein [Saprospiraceae bacterium]